MLIAQQIANLLNGVSQRPVEQRHSSQAEEQKNGLSSIARGLMMRPPLKYLGKLTGTITGWSSAFVHSINRDPTERYHVVVANGDVQAFDAINASAVTVIAPQGKTYLTDATGAGFRATTIGDTTIIVNRGTTVAKTTKKEPTRAPEALVYVRQADFSTVYVVTLNGVPVAIKTQDATTATTRVSIGTDVIASDISAALQKEPQLTGFTFTQYGSTIHIARSDSADFTLAVEDSIADKGLKAVKGQIQTVADLPLKAPKDFVIEIVNDPDSTKDNYWVKFTDAKSAGQAGVWRECPQPGTPVELNKTTLPHRLIRKGNILRNTPHTGVPSVLATFVASLVSAVVQVAWTNYTPSNTAIAAGVIPVVRDHNNGVKFTAASAGKQWRVFYSVDTSVVEAGVVTTVELYKNAVKIASATHQPGTQPPNPDDPRNPLKPPPPPPSGGGNTRLRFPFYMSPAVVQQPQGPGYFFINSAIAVSDVIELRLSYSTGVTPATYRRATMTFETDKPVEIIGTVGKTLTFPAAKYPNGMQITVTLGGVNFQRTSSADETGVTVASAFQALIDADVNYVATNISGQPALQVSRADSADFTSTFSYVFDETKTFWNPDIIAVAAEHVGRTIKNLTDGSSGTVTSNTTTTITASAGLSGGLNNKFLAGDICMIVGSGRYFVFEPCPWNERGAGSLEIVPFPSFLDKQISEVFFYQNRLGFTCDENIVLSSAGDLFNFFRYMASDLLDSDMIDVRSAHGVVSLFHSAVLWNGGLYFLSENARFRLSGEPALTPKTVRLDLEDNYETSKAHRPVAGGNRLFASRGKSGFSEVIEYSMNVDDTSKANVLNISADAPKLVAGKPVAMIGDSDLGFLAVVSDGNQRSLFVYSYKFENNERVQSSWSRWEFPAGTTVIGLDMVDRTLGVVTLHSDGAYIGTIDLDVVLDVLSADEAARYLDRRVQETTAGVSAAYNAGPDTTTWTLPFNVATDGSQGTLVVVKRSPQVTLLTTTRPAANQIAVTGQGDLTAASVYIGISYDFRYKLSRIFKRDRNGSPETSGRLILRYLDIYYNQTTDFSVTVTPDGRPAHTYTVKKTTPSSGKLRVPVATRNKYATIEIVNSTPGSCAFVGLDWEGDFTLRDRRI